MDGDESKAAAQMMVATMVNCGRELERRAVALFGKNGGDIASREKVKRLAEVDTTAFRWASVYGLGSASMGGSISYMISRNWRSLFLRIPFVSFTTLFVCWPLGYLYGTKKMVDSLLLNTRESSATSHLLCPSLENLRPCLDDAVCSKLLRKDFGGKTMLKWRELCHSRPDFIESLEYSSQQRQDQQPGQQQYGWESSDNNWPAASTSETK